MKTLVVKLAGVVEDSTLARFGELKMSVVSVAEPTADSQHIGLAGDKPIKLEITGNGYFTDSNLTANLGKTITVAAGPRYTVYLSNGNYTVSILNKYDINDMHLRNNRCLNIDIKDLADMINLRNLIMEAVPGISGDIAVFSQLVNLEIFAISSTVTSGTGRNYYGNISAFAGMTKAREIYIQNDIYVSGDTSSLAHLHPDNGGSLNTFTYYGTAVAGDWPPS